MKEWVVKYCQTDGYTYFCDGYAVFNYGSTKEDALMHLQKSFDEYEENLRSAETMKNIIFNQLKEEEISKEYQNLTNMKCLVGEYHMDFTDIYYSYIREKAECKEIKVKDVLKIYTVEEHIAILSNKRFVG